MDVKRIMCGADIQGYRVCDNSAIGVMDVSVEDANHWGLQRKSSGDIYVKDKDYYFTIESQKNYDAKLSVLSEICFFFGNSPNFCDFYFGDTLADSPFKPDNYAKRFCFHDLMHKIAWSDKRLIILDGIKSTGKNVLMKQAILELLQLGIPSSKVVYLKVRRGVQYKTILWILNTLIDDFHVEYIFLDDFDLIEFIKSAEYGMMHLSYFTEKSKDVKFILAGASSGIFISPARSVWKGKFEEVNTNYFSKKEFDAVYSEFADDLYVKTGGFLFYKGSSVRTVLGLKEDDANKFIIYLRNYLFDACSDSDLSLALGEDARILAKMCLDDYEGMLELIKCCLVVLCNSTIKEFIFNLSYLCSEKLMLSFYEELKNRVSSKVNVNALNAMNRFLCDLFGSLITDNKIDDFKPTLYTEITALFIFMRAVLDNDIIPDLNLNKCYDLIYNFLYKKAMLS